MNINNVKRPQPRYIDPYWSYLNIQAYGKDNLYPQRLFDLIRNSSVGGACLDRYETFIEGDDLETLNFPNLFAIDEVIQWTTFIDLSHKTWLCITDLHYMSIIT